MEYNFRKLRLDLASYRKAVDKISSSALSTPEEWQARLRDVLICATELYLDYQLFIKALPGIEAPSSKAGRRLAEGDVSREKTLREKLGKIFQSPTCWSHQFKPVNPFSGSTGLLTRQDYADKFCLHLPEIYGETIRIETCTNEFMRTRNGAALAQIEVGLQHLGQNHISFVLHALEWASDEGSWST